MKPSEALQAHRVALRDLMLQSGVEHPRVYGSALIGADTEDSDLDLLVEPTDKTTLFALACLEHAAQELLGVRVSILTPDFLSEKFRRRVLELAQPL